MGVCGASRLSVAEECGELWCGASHSVFVHGLRVCGSERAAASALTAARAVGPVTQRRTRSL